jgi:hypothetical protein
VAGNVTTFGFVLDVTGPSVTVKADAVGSAADGYEQVSFKLFDAYKVDKLTLNGVEKDLADNPYSDLNGSPASSVRCSEPTRSRCSAARSTSPSGVLARRQAPPRRARGEQGAVIAGDVRAWTASRVYVGGETVAHGGHAWRASGGRATRCPVTPTVRGKTSKLTRRSGVRRVGPISGRPFTYPIRMLPASGWLEN